MKRIHIRPSKPFLRTVEPKMQAIFHYRKRNRDVNAHFDVKSEINHFLDKEESNRKASHRIK